MGKKKLFTPEDFDKVVDKPWYKKPIIWFACAFIVALIITGFCFLKLKPEVQTSGPEGGAVRPDTVPEVITPQDTLVSEPIN